MRTEIKYRVRQTLFGLIVGGLILVGGAMALNIIMDLFKKII